MNKEIEFLNEIDSELEEHIVKLGYAKGSAKFNEIKTNFSKWIGNFEPSEHIDVKPSD